MTNAKKDKIINAYNSTLLTIILALLGYIGVMLQSNFNVIDKKFEILDIKIEKVSTIEYVDKQDYYLRLHIVESYKRMDEKLNIYVKQNNKIQN